MVDNYEICFKNCTEPFFLPYVNNSLISVHLPSLTVLDNGKQKHGIYFWKMSFEFCLAQIIIVTYWTVFKMLTCVARRDPWPRSASAVSDRGRSHVSGDGSFGPGRGNIRSRWHTRTLQSGRPPGGCRSKRGSRRAGSLPESKSDSLTFCSNFITSIF